MNILYTYAVLAYAKIDDKQLPHVSANKDSLETVIQIAFGVIGALALLMITVSGFRYITSAGDPQKASNAKNGIIYALVGLIIALMAESIIAFVVTRI